MQPVCFRRTKQFGACLPFAQLLKMNDNDSQHDAKINLTLFQNYLNILSNYFCRTNANTKRNSEIQVTQVAPRFFVCEK